MNKTTLAKEAGVGRNGQHEDFERGDAEANNSLARNRTAIVPYCNEIRTISNKLLMEELKFPCRKFKQGLPFSVGIAASF